MDIKKGIFGELSQKYTFLEFESSQWCELEFLVCIFWEAMDVIAQLKIFPEIRINP